MAETYTPTTGMASAAKRALQWHADGHPGGTAVGLARANQLKDREPLSEDVVLRMFSFFSRHEVDKQATGFSSGEEGFPSKGRVAWDLWGGDGGYSWSREKRDHIMSAREGKSLTNKAVGMEELNKVALTAFASAFSFYLKTHGFHWNTTGPDFYEYHLLFERIYSDAYEAIDPFAENIRTLQVFVPASLSGLSAITQVEDCTDAPPPTKDEMVAELIDDNETLLQLLKNAYNLCELYGKFGFQNFLADRLTAHESYGWLLRSSI